MIPEQQWLVAARRLAIGMKIRVRHLNESRPNMVIANDADRWWCYCQRCKEGGVVLKEHVLLKGSSYDPIVELAQPKDIRPLSKSDFEVPVIRFLISKNMVPLYLPELYYSEARRRLMLKDDSGLWHGRDLTGASPMKWLNYNAAHYVGTPPVGCPTVITEDLFSMYKVRYAMRSYPEFQIVCALGTGCSIYLTDALSSASSILWFFDGDSAGDDGASAGARRMRVFCSEQRRVRPPDGMDPKDMTLEQIRTRILNKGD